MPITRELIQEAVNSKLHSTFDTDDMGRMYYNAAISMMDHPVVRFEKWSSESPPDDKQKKQIDKLKPLFTSEEGGYFCTQIIIDGIHCQVEYNVSSCRFTLKMLSDGYAATTKITSKFKKIFPETENSDETVPFKFWRQSQSGGIETTRRLDCPIVSDIELNYEKETWSELSKLFSKDFKPSNGLILWHGAPGLGKTYCLRALVRNWKDWCSAEVILDPEIFFGAGAAYMMGVLLGKDSEQYFWEDDEDDLSPKKKWRLLILEDAGELISRDAKMQAGQGFSRMLNLCDGLIGQGFHVMVLITTNEDLGAMNEAALRSGRCLSSVSFREFDLEQANSWRSSHGLAPSSKRGLVSLSDLYAELRGDERSSEKERKVGF